MQHRRMSSASSTVELSYLLPTEDEESEPGILSPRLLSHAVAGLRASKFFLGRSRWILHALRSVVRAANLQPEESKFVGARGFIATVFGFTTSNEDELKETAWLDGLRGVAAFLVMVNHYHLDTFAFSAEAPYGSSNTQPWEIWRLPYFRIIWCSGSLQVGIFFVLSGFVLSWSSLCSIREGRPENFVLSLSSSAFRRWMRLFVPCFLIGLLSLVQFYIGLIDLPVITRKNSFVAQFVDYIWECQRFANPFTLDREGWDVRHKYNATMWTMPVEWAGSLIVFVVLLSVSRIQNFTRRAIVLLGVPIYCCLSAKWNYWLFTTGILLADYVKQAGGFEDLSKRMTFRSRFFWVSILLIGGWLGGIPGNYGWYERPGYE
jgi:peptidoglycan/LPS O-acetylase OafA/YrhL